MTEHKKGKEMGVANQKNTIPQEEPQWVELNLEFEPWPDI